MPSTALQFLIIDKDPEGRDLLSRNLQRHFPGAAIIDCDDADAAQKTLEASPISTVLLHRALDADGVSLIRRVRDVNPHVPILALSGIDRAAECLAAGASDFLLYDKWSMVGRVVENLLAGT
jgi:DNA-binding response OmpR family regulator